MGTYGVVCYNGTYANVGFIIYRFTGQAVMQISFNGISVVTSNVVLNVTTNCIKVSIIIPLIT